MWGSNPTDHTAAGIQQEVVAHGAGNMGVLKITHKALKNFAILCSEMCHNFNKVCIHSAKQFAVFCAEIIKFGL